MSTLESAGYVYDPWTTTALFGQPPNLMLGPENKAMPLGASDSMLPTLATPEVQDPSIAQGSNKYTGYDFAAKNDAASKQRAQEPQMDINLLLFAGILAVIFWSRR
jgi:hypothetical protein